MLMLIDIGNTNVVCAVMDQGDVKTSLRIESNLNFFNSFIQLKAYDIHGAVISSVVPSLTNIYMEACRNIFQIEPICVSFENVKLGFDVDFPGEVGNDRICNAVAASALFSLPAIVVDFGTATTYDVIDESGRFAGGAIAPGIDVSARYLFEKAALLRETAFTMPDKVIGKNTATNLQSGIMYAAIDSVQGMIQRILKETQWKNCSIILTGGFSNLISPELSLQHHHAPNLTLEGMRIIYEQQ